MNDDTFAGHPVSMGEARAARDRDASKWTPRECLVALLRAIDEGEIVPKEIIISYVQENGGERAFGHYVSASDVLHGIGLLEAAKLDYRDYSLGRSR